MATPIDFPPAFRKTRTPGTGKGGVVFSHPNPNLDPLVIRFAPTEVDWSYSLVTSETQTYAGQVVQLLSVNFESFTIQGRFGNDSRDDYELQGSAWVRKNPPSTVPGNLGPGLTQMTEWFKMYFAIASQGLPQTDSYDQQPVTISYSGAYQTPIDTDKTEAIWKVYPTSFPSYRIANDNFAPEWKVECQVFEAPTELVNEAMQEAIARLEYKPLYQPGSKFADPYPELDGPNATADDLRKAAKMALDATKAAADFYVLNLPSLTPSDVEEMITRGFSVPAGSSTPNNKAADNQSSPQPNPVPGMRGVYDTSQ